MSRRPLFSLSVVCLALYAPILLGQTANKPPANELRDVFVAMRDGVKLATDVFLPAQTGRWPAILVRTPYSRHDPSIRGYRFFVQHGYALVVQDLRGSYASQGTFGLVSQEGPDGNDAINWVAAQPWSNGRVAMAGSSYMGLVQWWAAIEGNSHLRAISPMFSGDDEYFDRYYSAGGALQIGHRLSWLAENYPPRPGRAHSRLSLHRASAFALSRYRGCPTALNALATGTRSSVVRFLLATAEFTHILEKYEHAGAFVRRLV